MRSRTKHQHMTQLSLVKNSTLHWTPAQCQWEDWPSPCTIWKYVCSIIFFFVMGFDTVLLRSQQLPVMLYLQISLRLHWWQKIELQVSRQYRPRQMRSVLREFSRLSLSQSHANLYEQDTMAPCCKKDDETCHFQLDLFLKASQCALRNYMTWLWSITSEHELRAVAIYPFVEVSGRSWARCSLW